MVQVRDKYKLLDNRCFDAGSFKVHEVDSDGDVEFDCVDFSTHLNQHDLKMLIVFLTKQIK